MNSDFFVWVKQSLATHFKKVCNDADIKFRIDDDEQNTDDWQEWVTLRVPECTVRLDGPNKYTVNIEIDLLITCQPSTTIFNVDAIAGLLQSHAENILMYKAGEPWFCLTLDRELVHSTRMIDYGRLHGVKTKRASLLAFYETEIEVT